MKHQDPTTPFGVLLQDWMRRNGCDHSRAAVRLGVHRATIYQWLRGGSAPPAGRLYHIARVMGEPIERMARITGRAIPKESKNND